MIRTPWRSRAVSVVSAVALVAASGCAVSVGDGAPRGAAATGDDLPEVDAVFVEYDRPDSPGCALGIVRDGELDYARGYGMADLDNAIPIGPETVFRIGSVSKQFAAMIMLLLEEDEVLSLDDDIRVHLPEMPDFGHTITIRHLIHHTSGLRDYLVLMRLAGYRDDDYYDEPELYDMLTRQQDLNFEPGSEFLYSNSGYFLLSQIVERATGKTLGEAAQERIFEPLGMDSSHFHDDYTHVVPGRAHGYAPLEGGGFSISDTRLPMVGDGGVYTSVEDLVAWDRNFYDNRLGTRGGPRLIDTWLTAGSLNDGEAIDYSAGIRHHDYRGLRLVSHGGAFVGYRADMLRFPDQRVGIIVLCNLATTNPSSLALEVADVILGDEMTEPRPEQPDRPEREGGDGSIAMTAEQLGEYEGDYYSPELDVTYTVAARDGSLTARVRRLDPFEFSPVAEDVFRAGGLELRFGRDAAGRVSGFELDAGRVVGLRFEGR